MAIKPIPAQSQTPAQKCRARGGIWHSDRGVCVMPKDEDKEEEKQSSGGGSFSEKSLGKVTPTTPEITLDKEGNQVGITLPDGRFFGGLSQDDVQQIAAAQLEKTTLPAGTTQVGTAQRAADVQAQGQQLAGQVGQGAELGVSPTGLDVGEAAIAGVVGAIPRALGLAATGAAVGAAGGTAIAPGVGTAAGAAIGAAAGFVSGLASSMIGNFKSQRTDTTTAQQRVLDEGKQTLKDWATLAKNDPANRASYLAEYNKQSSQINQAYRQMKLDTSRDFAKFETALPNLAEFESYYSAGGERDILDIEMRNALLTPVPEGYDLYELDYRRNK